MGSSIHYSKFDTSEMVKFSNLLLLPYVLATQSSDMQGDYNSTNAAEMAEDDPFRRFNKAISMTAARLCIETDCTGYTKREVNANIYRALRNYGCNCFPEEADRVNHYISLGLPAKQTNNDVEWHHGFYGPSVDELDQLCALTYRRFNCLEKAVGDTIPTSAHQGFDCFRGTTHAYHVDSNNEVICGGSWNPNYANDAASWQCEKVVCGIELAFANEAWRAFDPDQGGVHHSEFATVNSENYNMNAKGMCNRSSAGTVDQQCCGEFPTRLSYNSNVLCCEDNEVRQC